MNDRDIGIASDDAAARVRASADGALTRLLDHGFEQAQVTASVRRRQEVNIAHNEPSLLRSGESPTLALMGILGGRKACLELTDFDDDAALEARIAALRVEVASAPADDANAVSSGEQVTIEQGPLVADLEVLRTATRDLLEFRARNSRKTMIEEASISHQLCHWHTLTSGGSDLSGCIGAYEVATFCVARDGKAVSSFDATGGTADDLDGDISARFGIGEMLTSVERQIHPQPISQPFVGAVVLAPNAVSDLLQWLLEQLGDSRLIAGTSLYRNKVGQRIASPLFTLRSRFAAPGVAAVSSDAFRARPIEVVERGELRCLLPSLYGSRKTGFPHVPVADGGWEVGAGSSTRTDIVEGVARGALVGRLSMGNPASNGDFSGVIKNAFSVSDGQLGYALSETMISGNVSQMLCDIDAVSAERIDSGLALLPWMRVPGLHFS